MLEMMNLEELMVARGIELDIHQLPTTQDEREKIGKFLQLLHETCLLHDTTCGQLQEGMI